MLKKIGVILLIALPSIVYLVYVSFAPAKESTPDSIMTPQAQKAPHTDLENDIPVAQ